MLMNKTTQSKEIIATETIHLKNLQNNTFIYENVFRINM